MGTATNWSERTRPKHHVPPSDYSGDHTSRQQFNRPRTSMGAAGHWIHMAGVLAPVAIGELVQNAEKRWRYVRLVSVGTALAYEAVHTLREQKRREELEEERNRCCDKSR